MLTVVCDGCIGCEEKSAKMSDCGAVGGGCWGWEGKELKSAKGAAELLPPPPVATGIVEKSPKSPKPLVSAARKRKQCTQ